MIKFPRPSGHITRHPKVATWFGAAAGSLCALIWAGQAVLSRLSSHQGLTAVDVSILRFLASGLLMLPFALKMTPPVIGSLGWKRAVTMTTLAGLPYSVVLVGGAAFAPALHSAVLLQALIPTFTSLLAIFLLHQPFTVQRLCTIAILLTGTAIFSLGLGSGEALRSGAWRGDLLFVTAAAMFATMGTLSRVWMVDTVSATITVCVLSLIPIPLLFVTVSSRFAAAGLSAILLQTAYHGVLVGIIGLFLYLYAVKTLGAFRAALFLGLVPVFTALLSFLILAEVPSFSEMAGLTLVLAGLACGFAFDSRALRSKGQAPSSSTAA